MAMSAALKARVASTVAISKCFESTPSNRSCQSAFASLVPRAFVNERQNFHPQSTTHHHRIFSDQLFALSRSFQREWRGKGGRMMCMASANVQAEVEDHAGYFHDIADITPPPLLSTLLKVLQASGEEVVSPTERASIIPLVVPLSRNSSTGELTGILRWPTPPEGMEMPVVRVQKNGQLWLLAKTIEEYLTRRLAEEDASGGSALAAALGDEVTHLYSQGDFASSKAPNVNVYLMKSVGKFPDVFEQLAAQHLERKDEVSSLVTAEYYARKHFPGFGRAFVYNSVLFKRLGRKQESRDAARIALKCPWWTLGASYNEVCDLAGWGGEQLDFVKEKLTSEATQQDITKGKSPEQVALDQAAYMMDIAAAENNWDDVREEIARLYDKGGLPKLARFFRAVGSS